MKIATLAAAPLSINVLLRDQIKMLQGEGHEVVAVCGEGPMVEDSRVKCNRRCTRSIPACSAFYEASL